MNAKKYLLFIFYVSIFFYGSSQNSLIGDGFGGRLWYKPYNYTVGSYSGYTVCGDSFQLFGWGRNSLQQLGNGANKDSHTPVAALGMTNVKFYTCGYVMAAIKCDSSGWTWSQATKGIPTRVIEGVKFTDAGSHTASYIKTDGSVWSIGSNTNGEFGNGASTSTITTVPQQMNLPGKAVRVACGASVTVMLMENGTVRTCGTNYLGLLGNGWTRNVKSMVPVAVPDLTNIVDIKSTAIANVALDSAGNVFQWGRRTGKIYDSVPIKWSMLKNIVAISGSDDGDHFLAIDKDRNCYGWCGSRIYMGLGPGPGTIDSPTLVATNVVEIMAGELFSYIVKADGSFWASGTSIPIWMDSTDKNRAIWTRLHPENSPMFLCNALPFRQTVVVNDSIGICASDSLWVKDRYYKPGMYYTDLIKGNTCTLDTVVKHSIVVKGIGKKTQQVTICPGDTFTIGLHQYMNPGTYYDTLYDPSGCPTWLSTVLTHSLLNYSTLFKTICRGDTFVVGKHRYFDSGEYLDTVKTPGGCNTYQTTRLTVTEPIYQYQEFYFCPGDTIWTKNSYYTHPGNRIDTLIAPSGCDLIFTTSFYWYPVSYGTYAPSVMLTVN